MKPCWKARIQTGVARTGTLLVAGLLSWYFAPTIAQHFGYSLSEIMRIVIGALCGGLTLLIVKGPLDFTEDCMRVPDCHHELRTHAAAASQENPAAGRFSDVVAPVAVHGVVSCNRKGGCRLRHDPHEGGEEKKNKLDQGERGKPNEDASLD